MAVEINPIRLIGNWDWGYALDIHVIKSVPIGEDVYGNVHFDNTRSPIGELLYQFKYNGRYENLDEIVETILVFLDSHPEVQNVDIILPVPPTKIRHYQPTFEIARKVAGALNIFYSNEILENHSRIESKELMSDEKHKLQGMIVKTKSATRKHNMLLIDDLYKTGTTLQECVNVLREDPLIDKIFVLTITKTKNS